MKNFMLSIALLAVPFLYGFNESALSCNEKIGVNIITTSYPDCDEPINVVAPCITFHRYKNKVDDCKVMLLGVEHRYEKSQGINTRIHLSAMKQSLRQHMAFIVEGMYKFKSQYEVAIYPILGISWYRWGVNPLGRESHAYCWKNNFHAGLGIERIFNNILLIGVKGHLIKDLDTRTFGEYHHNFIGVIHSPSLSYKVSAYFHLSIFGKVVFEIEPYYGRCFENKFKEAGTKICFSQSF